jgi:UDP-N-acetyl-D-glucosamine dehydrogenase
MLREKIIDKKALVVVIGAGYVGLPLAVSSASVGFKTICVDMQQSKVDKINMGKNYIADVQSEELKRLVDKGILSATTDFKLVKEADIVIICVPTPLNKNKDPDTSYIEKTSHAVSQNIKKGTLVVLESTTYPGTTEEIVKPEIEKSGLVCGKDFYLCFSPERVDPGNPTYKIKNITKVIGGYDKNSGELASLFYASFIEKTYIVSSTRAAEMTKLLENTFRLVNISMINELALLCGKMGLDIWEIIEAAKTKPYGFMPFYPGPGIGGHCIPDDPFYLSWKAKEFDFYARFITLAGEINGLMPHYVVTKINSALNSIEKSIKGSKILLLGMAYKKDIDDIRESPSLKVFETLLQKGAKVSYNDDFVEKVVISNETYISEVFKEENLKNKDCVVILTDHSYYKEDFLLANAKLLVDVKNVIKTKNPKITVMKL